MKALTMFQPFASLLVGGVKRYETRSFRTNHRGPLAITSSAKFPPELKSLCYTPKVASYLAKAGIHEWESLPLGMLLGAVEVTDCTEGGVLIAGGKVDVVEHALGDFSMKRFGWKCERPWVLPEPVKVRGHLGVWDLHRDLSDLLELARGGNLE